MLNIAILPILIPLLLGTTALIRFRQPRRLAVIAGTLLNLVVALLLLYLAQGNPVLVSQMGGHPAPFGIALVLDPLSAIMLVMNGVIAFAVVLFSLATIDANRERFAYYPLLGFLMLGINFAFLTGDIFTLYVAFEVMLMASFVMLTLGGERGQLEGGLKYVALNLVSSTIFLIAIGLTYAVAGTLNMADLSQRLAGLESPGITTVLAMLYLLAFGIKAAVFPLFFWLPASYHTPPIAVTAMFGGMLTKVGIYSMWRVLTMVFPQEVVTMQPLILTIAGLTMVTGVLGAIAQMDVRRLLSFHIISQIGYLLMGFGLFTAEGLTGAVFFMMHVILAKTALFFVSGIMHEVQGNYNLKKLGGLQKSHPVVALLFWIAALALAGIPPFSGFWGKLFLIRAGLAAEQYGIVAVGLIVSLFTFYSMVKIWQEAFWKKQPETVTNAAISLLKRRFLMTPTMLLVVLVIVIGILVEPFYRLSQQAADGILNTEGYIQTVLVTSEEVQP